jgi:hypothetical protein
MGGIYMAVIIALIVGRYMSLQSRQDPKRDSNLEKEKSSGSHLEL